MGKRCPLSFFILPHARTQRDGEGEKRRERERETASERERDTAVERDRTHLRVTRVQQLSSFLDASL